MFRVSVLETVVRTPPLGVRCVDSVTGVTVARGLRVSATALDRDRQSARGWTIDAVETRSGLFSVQGLPGLWDFETRAKPYLFEAFPVSSPPAGYVVEVVDTQGRYLPVAMIVDLPKEEVLHVPMFATPAAPAIPGFAIVRGALADYRWAQADGLPRAAAYARIEAQYIRGPDTGGNVGAVYTALSDERGQFLLLLPFPNPFEAPPGTEITSPNARRRPVLADLSWPLELCFYYAPTSHRYVCTGPDGMIAGIEGRQRLPDQAGWHIVPDIESLLTQGVHDQSSINPSYGLPAQGIEPIGSPPQYSLTVGVRLGEETVARVTEGDPYIRLKPPPS